MVLVLAFAVLSFLARAHPPPPRADALRYFDYALNLHQHGVFGLGGTDGEAPAAGRANVPLYPALLAAVLAAVDADSAALRCHLRATAAPCAPVPAAVYRVQRLLAALALTATWWLAWQLGGGRRAAALAGAATLMSGQLQDFADQLLTENLSMPLFALATLAFARAWSGSAPAAAAAGALLGLLTLTRPEFLYLAAAAGAVVTLRAVVRRRPYAVRSALCLVVALLVTVLPWAVRNRITFGDSALTVTYGGQVLAQRVQYNRMGMTEIAAAFVYWLPSFGDSLAARVLPKASYARLGFGPGSYYRDGLAHFDTLVEQTGNGAAATGRMLHDEVLGQAAKHFAVTVALAWRGLFVGKLWGLVGLVAFGWILHARPALRWSWLLIAGPAWLMLFLYAAVSVCVPRYAVCLVPTFALAQAFSVEHALTRRRGAAA